MLNIRDCYYFFNQTSLELQLSKYDLKIDQIIIMHLRMLKTFST